MPATAPIPYTPIGTPLTEKVKCNGLDFETVTWKVPQGVEYKGKIIYVHGFAEHCSLYTELFDKLSQKGYEAFFFDQRGSGETSPGKAVGVTDEYHTFKDLDFMINRALENRSDTKEKFFLGGHSMGGGIALNYAIKGTHRDDIRGIFVTGPLVTLHPNTEPNIIVMKLQGLINALVPKLKIDSKLKHEYITSHEGWIDYIKSNDGKLVGTVRQFNDMFVRGRKLLSPDYVSKYPSSIPLLLLHGTDDNINHIESSKKFIDLLPSNVDKDFVPIEKGRHSLFIENETIFADVLDRVLKFLDSH